MGDADAFKNAGPSPWFPITDRVQLAILGKLQEELGELMAIVARCIIQGVDGVEPVTGVHNRLALEKELADVRAGIEIVVTTHRCDMVAMDERTAAKIVHLRRWHELIREAERTS